MAKYMVLSRGKVIGVFDTFIEAIQTLVEIGGGEIYRGELIVKLEPEEASELKGYLSTIPPEPVEAPVKKTQLINKKVVVLDQMFKGFFAEVLSRELRGVDVYEIVGRGLASPIRVGNVVKYPAETDYDIASLVESLAKDNYSVYFFTGDKKLYTHVSSIQGVKAFYMPPSEYPSKEFLVKEMIMKIRSKKEINED